jgi:hypothetical protein
MRVFLVILLFSFIFAFGVSAQTEIVYPSIPGTASPQQFLQELESPEEVLPHFMTYLFQLFLVASIAVVVLVVIYGGVLYIISSDNPKKKKNTKS